MAAGTLEEARTKAHAAVLESTLDLWITRSYTLEEFDAVTELEQAREEFRLSDAEGLR